MTRIRLTGLVAALALLGAVCLVVLRRRPEDKVLAPAPPAPATPEAPITPPELPEAPRTIPLGGHVLARGAVPLAGITVAIGDATTVTDGTGAFHLPDLPRSRRGPLRILRGDTQLARFHDVVSGAMTLGATRGPSLPSLADAALAPAWDEERADSRTERIRWTVCLLTDGPTVGESITNGSIADGSAGTSGPQGSLPWLRVDSVLCEDVGHRARITVKGSSRLPDGALVTMSLYFEDNRLLGSGESAEVGDGAFEGVLLTPPDFRLHSAEYVIEVAFSAVLQRAEFLERWERALTEDRELPMDVDVAAHVCLGDPEDARAEDIAVAAYYDRVLEEVRTLERTLKSGVEDVLDLLYGWDPALLRKCLDEDRFAELAARSRNWAPSVLAARREARSGWFYGDVVEGGVFREDRWRRFLDEQWRPALKRLQEAHEARVSPKYPEAEARLSALLAALLEESCNLSSFIVVPSYLPRHPNDDYPDEDREGDMRRLENLVKGNFKELQRYRRLGRE